MDWTESSSARQRMGDEGGKIKEQTEGGEQKSEYRYARRSTGTGKRMSSFHGRLLAVCVRARARSRGHQWKEGKALASLDAMTACACACT